MLNHSLTAWGTDLPFSHKSVMSTAHEQNIICSKTLICRQLFAGHMVGSRPMKRKGKIHRMITIIIKFSTLDKCISHALIGSLSLSYQLIYLSLTLFGN